MTVKKLLEGRWFGHPLHPLLSHLPMGLWLLAVVFDVMGRVMADGRWALEAATWTLVAGTAAAVVTAITGLNDWMDIREDRPGQTAALWHMAMMLPATVIYAVDTGLHFVNRGEGHITHVMLGLSVVGYLLVIVGGYIGGTLVYNEGISVGRHRRGTELPQHTIHEPRKGTTGAGLAPAVGLASEYRPLLPESAVAEGQTQRVEIHGTVVTLARAGGKVYAVQEFCTHRCGPLSEGTVEGGAIRCPWHNSRFNLADGKVINGPAKEELKTYEVRVHKGIVHVCMDRCAPLEEDGAEGRGAERRNPGETASYAREQEREGQPRRSTRDS